MLGAIAARCRLLGAAAAGYGRTIAQIGRCAPVAATGLLGLILLQGVLPALTFVVTLHLGVAEAGGSDAQTTVAPQASAGTGQRAASTRRGGPGL